MHHLLSSLEVNVLASHDLTWRVVWFGWDYYIGVMVIVIIVATRTLTRWFRQRVAVGQGAALILSLGLCAQIVYEWSQSVLQLLQRWNSGLEWEGFPRWGSTAFNVFVLGLYLVEAAAFFVVLALIFAEIFDLAAIKRELVEKRSRA